jgi:hypothetical protein
MNTKGAEKGAVLMTAVLLGILLSMLGGVAMNFAWTETELAGRHVKESSGRLLAESGLEQVIAWFNHADLPLGGEAAFPLIFAGTETAPDIVFDAARVEHEQLLNDPHSGAFRTLGDLGRVERIVLYGSARPEGLCTAEVTARTTSGVRRSASVELGATRVPPLTAAIHAGSSRLGETPRIRAHWGPIRLAGDINLGRNEEFPKKLAGAAVTGLGYTDSGGSIEDRWSEAWIGGRVGFEESEGLPANIHVNQDPLPGLPADPWQYQKFKELAMRFGTYYVPDGQGLLYRNGHMDPSLALTPAEVFGNGSLPPVLIFVDTLDQKPPAAGNLGTVVLNSPFMEGTFFINAHVVLSPEGQGRRVVALSPPSDGTNNLASRVPVQIEDVTIHGILHTTGTLRVEHKARIFGSVIADRGLGGSEVLEVWFDYDLARGLVRGIPVVFPLTGTWREWGS